MLGISPWLLSPKDCSDTVAISTPQFFTHLFFPLSRCIQKPISCVPTDGFQVIATLDNTGSSFNTELKYSRTVGRAYTNEVTESMSVSTTVEQSLTESFFGIFESTLGE